MDESDVDRCGSVAGDRRPEPGERCTCGRLAVTVFVGSDGHETPWCGLSDVAPAEPAPGCPDPAPLGDPD